MESVGQPCRCRLDHLQTQVGVDVVPLVHLRSMPSSSSSSLFFSHLKEIKGSPKAGAKTREESHPQDYDLT